MVKSKRMEDGKPQQRRIPSSMEAIIFYCLGAALGCIVELLQK